MHSRKPFALIFAALLGPVALAQETIVPTSPAPSKVLTFEVATIKPSARTDGAWRLQSTADGYTGMDISLLTLVSEAYGIYDSKLLTGGPAWIDRDKFDIEAKFNAAEFPDAKNMTFRQRADMLQPLLAERFHLKVHREIKTFVVYNLVIAKDGPKLEETKPGTVYQGVGRSKLRISPQPQWLHSGPRLHAERSGKPAPRRYWPPRHRQDRYYQTL